MRTVTEDCHFLCVPQTDYVNIMSREGEAEIPEMGEGGRVVLVYESINLDTTLNIDSNKSSNDNSSVLLKKCRLVTKVCFEDFCLKRSMNSEKSLTLLLT